MNESELRERIARLEGMLESHEKNASERRSSMEAKFETIFKKIDAQNCTLHAARMLQLQQDIDKQEEHIAAVELKFDGRLSFLEKAYWTGVGGMTVLIFILKFLVK